MTDKNFTKNTKHVKMTNITDTNTQRGKAEIEHYNIANDDILKK